MKDCHLKIQFAESLQVGNIQIIKEFFILRKVIEMSMSGKSNASRFLVLSCAQPSVQVKVTQLLCIFCTLEHF